MRREFFPGTRASPCADSVEITSTGDKPASVATCRFGCNAVPHPSVELSSGGKTFSSDLNCALHLYARKSIRRAEVATAQMSVEGAHFLLWNLIVRVSVEFCLPRLTNHASPFFGSS